MSTEHGASWRFREYRAADIPAYVETYNFEYADEPTTMQQEQYWEESYPKDNPRLRLAVEDARGKFIGFGDCEKPFWGIIPGVYVTYALVHPEHRRCGLASNLLRRFQSYARGQGAEKLWTDCRESQMHSIAFLEANSFKQFGIRFEQALDLQAFDLACFAGAVERVERQGYRLITLAELRKERQDADRLLYEVFSESSLDIPLPGGAHISLDFEQWRKELDSPTADPAYIFLALKGDEPAGETMLELLKDGPAITSSTGVSRKHRGNGVALALKLASLQALKDRGYKQARTHNDTENPAILHLNQKIGYWRLPGWLQWEKRLE